MAIFIFFLSWFLVTALTDKPAIGFVVAVFSFVVYRQGARISKLEAAVKGSVTTLPSPTGETAPAPLPTFPAPPSEHLAASQGPVADRPLPLYPTPSKLAVTTNLATMSEGEASSSASIPVSQPVQQKTQRFSETLEQILGPTISSFIFRGNPIARVGVVILLFGVVFLLKFASDEGFIPIELRLLGAALGAFVLLGIGWKKRTERPQIALTLQGAGAGVFYVTVFIAFRLYHLIPGPLAFIFLVGVTVFSSALAVLQNARALAVLAMIGGFLAPALTSEGGGNHVLLFGYLSLLNLGIFGICWFRSWRAVNLTGFFFTFILSSLWGASNYRTDLFPTVEPFLLFFVVLYSVINVLFSLRSTTEKPGAIDTLMTFGTPFLGMLLQYGLVAKIEYGMAFSAAGFGAFYVALARYTFNKDRAKLRFLTESYFAVGLAFLSLAVPFAFSERLTSAVWALEAVALLWSGIRQKHFLSRLGGHVLLVLSAISFLSDIQYGPEDLAFLNPYFLSVVMLSTSFLVAGALLQRAKEAGMSDTERRYGAIYLAASLLCWFGGGYFEVWRHISSWDAQLTRTFPSLSFYWIPFGVTTNSIFASLSILGFWAIARRWRLATLGWVRLLLLPVHYLFFVLLLIEAWGYTGSERVHPFNSFGFVAWPLLFVVHYYIMRREESQTSAAPARFQHLLSLWLATAVSSWQCFWMVGNWVQGVDSWRYAALTVAPSVVIIVVGRLALASRKWPFDRSGATYLMGLMVPALWVFGWTLILNLFSSGDASPLPYVPLLHPLDLAQMLGVVVLLAWWKRCAKVGAQLPLSSGTAGGLLSAALFVWSTAILFRSAHHYIGIPWDPDALFDSSFIQSALSIYWSCLALILMLLAHAKAWRPIWKFGALLIAVVVIKLLLIDMSNQGTIARIAAFMGVGLLMLVIGYFAPIPPEAPTKESEN